MAQSVEEQLPLAFENMRRSIENAGGGIDNIAQVSLFLDDARQAMPTVNAVWVEMFPDETDRPTYKFISTPLPGGRLAQLEYFAVLGERRRVINIDGVAHTNPIPMGVRIGDYLFSSRVLPMDAKTGEYPPDVSLQADHLFANVGAVLAEAEMDWPDLTQERRAGCSWPTWTIWRRSRRAGRNSFPTSLRRRACTRSITRWGRCW